MFGEEMEKEASQNLLLQMAVEGRFHGRKCGRTNPKFLNEQTTSNSTSRSGSHGPSHIHTKRCVQGHYCSKSQKNKGIGELSIGLDYGTRHSEIPCSHCSDRKIWRLSLDEMDRFLEE